jgi:hypothetical protein
VVRCQAWAFVELSVVVVVNNNCTTKALSFFGEGIVKETGFLDIVHSVTFAYAAWKHWGF